MCRNNIAVGLIISLLMALCSQPQHYVLAEPIGVTTPAGAIGVVVTQISLATQDIIYDPLSNKIYASIPSSAGSSGNSIAPISVPTMTVGTPVFVGSEPDRLAISDDGKYLYVGLNGAAAVRRFNLMSQTVEIQFSLGSSFCGAFLAEDMVVLKGNPNAVAVSRRNTGYSPRHEGVAIYDDGVQRPTTTPGHTGSNVIEPSDSDLVLYGYNNETTEFGFRIMSVISSGIVVTSTTQGLISGFGTDIRFDNGLIYATNGAIINPSTQTLVGTYAASGLVYPDSTVGRVYFLSTSFSGQMELKIFDQATFIPFATVSIPGVSGTPSNLIKVGQNLLAFRTSAGQVFLLKLIQLDRRVYLPLILRPRPGISGRVTENGVAAAGVSLELRLYNGSSWSTLATATTDPDGGYAFTGVPSLGTGQKYYVRYQNTAGTSGRLWVWGTRELTSYSAGSSVEIGNFDIADIVLLSPADGATVVLPHTFRWTPRLATPSDNYEFDLYDPEDGDPYFYTAPPLGYVGSYTLSGLPAGFSPGVWYVWETWVYSLDGGFGISYETRHVMFSNTGIGSPTISVPLSPNPSRVSEDIPER